MRINWGTGIVIAFICFIGFLLFLVVKMSTDEIHTHDLVSQNFYEEELAYQNEIDKERNAKNLEENVDWERAENGLKINFPKSLDYQKIRGVIKFYRPSDKKEDFQIPLQLKGSSFVVSKESLLKGRWDIKVDWEYNQKLFLYKTKIIY